MDDKKGNHRNSLLFIHQMKALNKLLMPFTSPACSTVEPNICGGPQIASNRVICYEEEVNPGKFYKIIQLLISAKNV